MLAVGRFADDEDEGRRSAVGIDEIADRRQLLVLVEQLLHAGKLPWYCR